MLRRLAADQRRAGLKASLSHAFHDIRDLFRLIFAACDVVKEKQRLSARACDIIYTHRNRVDADRVMFIHEHGDLHLRAASVRAGQKYGIFHLFYPGK